MNRKTNLSWGLRNRNNNDQILESLREFGLTEYEAKIYYALLSIKEGTAWTIAKNGNVPQSKIYEVLSSLERKGFVVKGISKPQVFKVISPDQAFDNVIAKYSEELKTKIKLLKGTSKSVLEKLKTLEVKSIQSTSPFWIIKGKDNVFNKAVEILNLAERECLITGHRPLRSLNCMETLREIAKKPALKIMVLGNFSQDCIDFMNKTNIEFKVVNSFYEYLILIDEKELLLAISLLDGELYGLSTIVKEFVMANKNHFELIWRSLTPPDRRGLLAQNMIKK